MQAKPHSSLRALALLITGVGAALGPGVARAGPDDLDRVEVTGRRGDEPIHTNVRAACPDIAASLQSSLGPAQFREGREGITTVSFRLAGSQITSISQQGGPQVYRTDIRKAVHRLACSTGGPERLYVMRLEFRSEESMADGPQRIALVE